jgi:hypothetical protein
MNPNRTERNDTHGGPPLPGTYRTPQKDTNETRTERNDIDTRGSRPCLTRPGLHKGREWNPNDTRGAEPAWHVQDSTKHEWNPNDTWRADPAWHLQDFTKNTNGTRTTHGGLILAGISRTSQKGTRTGPERNGTKRYARRAPAWSVPKKCRRLARAIWVRSAWLTGR